MDKIKFLFHYLNETVAIFQPVIISLAYSQKIDDLLNKVLQVIGAGRYHIIDMESEKHCDYR